MAKKSPADKYSEMKSQIIERGDTIGPMIKGQLWVKLNGCFTADELKSIAANIERNNKVRPKK